MLKRLCKTWLDVKRELPEANRIKFMDYGSMPEMTDMNGVIAAFVQQMVTGRKPALMSHTGVSGSYPAGGRSKLERKSVCERLIEHFALEPGRAELRLAKSDKSVYHFRVELIAGTAHDFFSRFIESQRFAVRAARSDGIERVGDADDT